MLIQIILILAVLFLLLFFLRHHGKSKTAASVKIGFSLFMVFGLLAVLLPEEVTVLAKFLGVGRGTDLLLYGMVVSFGFATINTYLRFKELELRYAKLVRAVAIQNSEAPEDKTSESAASS
jgi:small membrane protein